MSRVSGCPRNGRTVPSRKTEAVYLESNVLPYLCSGLWSYFDGEIWSIYLFGVHEEAKSASSGAVNR